MNAWVDSASFENSIQERAYLKRVRLFFGHGIANVVAVLIGALLIATIMRDAAVPVKGLVIWVSIIFLLGLIVLLVERAFIQTELTLVNARKWIMLRTISGGAVGVMYGVSPFLFGGNLLIHHEMFLFIILSTMISVASTGYTLLPSYYFTLNAVTMLPLTAYFLLEATPFHIVLAITSLIWQIVVLSKSWKVSKKAINEIYLNENLRDEIEKHEKTKERLQHMATHDDLTGLPNRQLLVDRLDYLIKRALRYEKLIVVMFLDLDGFKKINDIYGHESGDRSLKEISNRLLSTIRETDIVARFGGDEFVLVYTDIDGGISEAEILAQRVLKLFEEPIILAEGQGRRVSGSIGIATFPGTADESRGLIMAADEAMYASKAKGKNSFTFAGIKPVS